MIAKKILIIGGVAAGASAAARARRLSHTAEIVVVEKGPYISYANCGLPYYVGGEIEEKKKLLPQTPETMKERHDLDIRVNTEALRIDRREKRVELRDHAAGRTYRESYDTLVIATGAAPVLPDIPGIHRPGCFCVRDVPDVEKITAWIESHRPRRALVAGGGPIGLEMAEQLRRKGLAVALAESNAQVVRPLDPEMAAFLHLELRANDVELRLGDPIVALEDPGPEARAAVAVLKSGARLPADLVILGMGVRPNAQLARECGLEIGDHGGIRVNQFLQTSDPHIWAAGDAIEVRNLVTGAWDLIPLAGPANRQGRIVADNIFGRRTVCRGSLGTAILRAFGYAAACVGMNESDLKKAGISFEAVHVHSTAHASYFPGAQPVSLKLLFDPASGRLLGAQAVGRDGIDKRIDVIASAMMANMTVGDLADLELAYAPPYGAPRDPVNLAGMAAQNVVRRDVKLAHWHEVERLQKEGAFVLDVRDPQEQESGGRIEGSVNIPLGELRARLGEIPRDREIVVHDSAGQRGYYATRILTQRGFRARNLSGGMRTLRVAREG